MFTTFLKKKDARTGNILFQYLMSKLVCLVKSTNEQPNPSLTYKCLEEWTEEELRNSYTVYEHTAEDFLYDRIPPSEYKDKNIIIDGFFQKSDYYIPKRAELLECLRNSPDYWIGFYGKKEFIRDFFEYSHRYEIGSKDIVISLRLDDFIQLPCPTSDIIPPEFYLDILEHQFNFDNLFIVCDTIRHDWERRYLDYFNKWNPVLIQDSLANDCAMMRDAAFLIHSNSTLCWFMSFLSLTPEKVRFIPKTNFYGGQNLGKIATTDTVINVSPMHHQAVFTIHHHPFLLKSVFPLSYCIPDECILTDEALTNVLEKKHIIVSDLIPGDRMTYRFSHDEEREYNEMYQESRFAYTCKKGGWDCLRHYEILANGCIPIFKEIGNCPEKTLTTFPKELVKEANQKLLPYKKDHKRTYDEYAKKIVEHTRKHCSTSGTVDYFLSILKNNTTTFANAGPKKVLLIRQNCGVNYTRELFWIGMKRYIQEQNGTACEYPKIDFLYDSYQGNKQQLYGNGFTYAYRIKDSSHDNFTEEEIIEKIENKFWDLIIYGKVGPDEGWEGSLPHMPFWDKVFKRYSKDEIVFLYGGDECQNMTYDNRYRNHLLHHSQYANCFVRELII